MAAWVKENFNRVRPRSQSSRNIFKPGNTTSVIFSKGLLNAPGDNNCFLNSAVQVLWHLDVFRRSFREMHGHACMGTSCIFCALKALFIQLQHSEETALPADALRKALATAFKDQLRFQLGCMDDAAECFENILVRIHFHLAHNIKEDLCDAKHCIPHRKFAMTLIEHSICKCGATSEPFPFTQMVHYVSSTTLCTEASRMRKDRIWPNTDHFGVLLRKAGAIGDVRKCPSSCGKNIHIRRILMNCPDVVSIGLIWDSDKPDIDHITDVICNLGTTIQLRELFDDTVDDRAKANSLFLVGLVTYYGRHYTTFFYNTNLRYWVYFDDAVVKQVGHNWSDVVDRCRRGHFQPLLLLYAYPDGKAVSTVTAPKRITMLKGYDKDDKENGGPLVHPNKPEESLLLKVLTEPEEPIPIHHYHGNSNSSTMSGQSASSNDSQNTLVYQPVGTVPEFQATSEIRTPPKGESSRDSRRNEANWTIGNDGSVANATRASWIPNSIVEIGHDALNYVPMKKPGEGSYAISQFALQGHDEAADRGTGSKTMPRVQNGGNQTERPSSAKDLSYGQRIQPMSPQQSRRPSSAQSKISRQSVRQVSSSVVSTNDSASQRTDTGSQGGAMYNAKTGMITGHKEAQSPQHVPQPSLTFEPYGNFATEVEREPIAQRNRQLNIKPLQEFSVRQGPQDAAMNPTNVLASNQQPPKTNVVRQGSWNNGSSGQHSGDLIQRTSSVQRASSLTIKPLDRYQDSHSSNPDLKSDANHSTGLNSNTSYTSSNGGQFPKYSSVPDLQRQMNPHDDIPGKQFSRTNPPAGGSRSLKRSPSLDQPVSAGGILDTAIRNREPTATQNQNQQRDGRHIPLMRSSSVTQNPEDKQARAKYNIQNKFLTLPGKKQANQFRPSSKQSLMSSSGGIGYSSAPQRDMTYHQSSSTENSSQGTSHHEGLTMRQTPEVHVSKGLDIDSIASRDSGYRSRDRSSASSGSVYSLDGHASDVPPPSVTASVSSNSHDKDISKYGHVHQVFDKNQPSPMHHQTSYGGDAQRPQTPTRQPGQQFTPSAADKSDRRTQGSEDVVIEFMQGVEEQLLSSKKAEEEGDLAIALGLCTAAASTLKIALRQDGLKDQTKLFLQTKYNTTVLKSRGLHRRLTLLRRSEGDRNIHNKLTPPAPPKPDYSRGQPIVRRDSREEIQRQEQDSMQQIALLKKRVEDLSSVQDTSRLYGQKSSTEQTDSSRSGYQPRQYQSVPSSPSLQRTRTGGNQTIQYGSATSMTSGAPVGHGHSRVQHDPSNGQGRVTQGHGVPQGSSLGPSGHQTSAPPVHKDWTQSQVGYTSGYATVGRSSTPLGFTSTSRPAEVSSSRYRSQTPTPYLGSTKPSSGYAGHHIHTTGNRNNNAITQQNGRDSARVYQNTASETQQRNYNQDWVQREQPRHDTRIGKTYDV
ncbi:uncharacterized protein LOC575657 isoform X3 [Strongylocentrotus purpuratus]|uniref:USP domain-containing protein n=1 Tax=Strongylocentrotus purpuratus TaxID=7668 RepID=A0A7M7NEJ8_STRPU|nr:uncharacterized protein LOC575657 isoform X3 [Strongylocentrotus purpuratus]